jgi:hypothetical protein
MGMNLLVVGENGFECKQCEFVLLEKAVKSKSSGKSRFVPALATTQISKGLLTWYLIWILLAPHHIQIKNSEKCNDSNTVSNRLKAFFSQHTSTTTEITDPFPQHNNRDLTRLGFFLTGYQQHIQDHTRHCPDIEQDGRAT